MGAIQARRDSLKKELVSYSYHKLAKRLGVSAGALWKFMNTDYVPTGNDLRRKLGIPELLTQAVIRNKKGQFASIKKEEPPHAAEEAHPGEEK